MTDTDAAADRDPDTDRRSPMTDAGVRIGPPRPPFGICDRPSASDLGLAFGLGFPWRS
jgi:hypothetical protein